MNTVSHEVRAFAHRAFVVANFVLKFQDLSHRREPNQRDGGVASPEKNLPTLIDFPFEVHRYRHFRFREQTFFGAHGVLGRHDAKNNPENSGW